MNMKTIFITGLCLIILVNPVFGYNELDDPKDYRLTELPYGYDDVTEKYFKENVYLQQFCYTDDEVKYPGPVYYIRTFFSGATSSERVEQLEREKNKYVQLYEKHTYVEVTEIYGFGEKGYKLVTGDGRKNILFVKKHILITVSYNDDFIFSEESISTIAKLYENKIDSVLDDAPQIFATIELEKGDNSIYYVGDEFIYYLTLSEDAHALIENQVNNDKWTSMESRFYEKGQHTLSLGSIIPPLGNEKIKLTATSLKGSEAVSTVLFISKEKVIRPTPTIDSIQKTSPKTNTPFLNPFIIFSIVIVVTIILNRQKKKPKRKVNQKY